MPVPVTGSPSGRDASCQLPAAHLLISIQVHVLILIPCRLPMSVSLAPAVDHHNAHPPLPLTSDTAVTHTLSTSDVWLSSQIVTAPDPYFPHCKASSALAHLFVRLCPPVLSSTFTSSGHCISTYCLTSHFLRTAAVASLIFAGTPPRQSQTWRRQHSASCIAAAAKYQVNTWLPLRPRSRTLCL